MEARDSLAHLKCKAAPKILDKGSCAVLAVTSISRYDPHLRTLLDYLAHLLTAHPWTCAVLNFFDKMKALDASMGDSSLQLRVREKHLRLAPSFVLGFKTLLWKSLLWPSTLSRFTHIMCFDSDLVVDPAEFDLVGMLRIGETINASLVQPAPYGPNAGLYALANPRCRGSVACSCGSRPALECAVCRQPAIEVKVPVFTRTAWTALYDDFFRHVPESVLTSDKMLDLTWCGFLDHKLYGGCTSKNMDPACTNRSGVACAVSYATPIRHLNHKTIERNLIQHKKAATPPRSPGRRLNLQDKLMDVGRLYTWLEKLGMIRFLKHPSWRPRNSLLFNPGSGPGRGGPCWPGADMTAAMNLRPVNISIEHHERIRRYREEELERGKRPKQVRKAPGKSSDPARFADKDLLCYSRRYPDLAKNFGTRTPLLRWHWSAYGKKEGRKMGCA